MKVTVVVVVVPMRSTTTSFTFMEKRQNQMEFLWLLKSSQKLILLRPMFKVFVPFVCKQNFHIEAHDKGVEVSC